MIMNIYQMRPLPPLFDITNIISVFLVSFEKNYIYQGEVHNFWELVYVKEGTLGVTAGDQILELQEGQIVFHKPGEFHTLHSAKGSSPTVFILTFTLDRKVKELENMHCLLTDFERSLMDTLISETSILETLVDNKTTLMSLKCHDESSYGVNHIIKNYIELLLLFVIKNHYHEENLQSTLSASQANYRKIASYIQANLFHKINIDMICENCNISHTSLKNIFRKYAGISTMEYVNQLKIQASIPLLESGCSHQEIADRLAFSSPYYFSTVFKRITGVSPKHFKDYNITEDTKKRRHS